MFKPVATQVDFAAQERAVLAFWKRTDAFDRLRQLRSSSERRFSFIDGPITANNPMGVHHAWGRTYKDLWQRYRAMQGFDQRWQNGFDCQGLWVEVNVEKELAFKNKHDIEAYGMTRFINLCKQRVLNSAATQTEQSLRLGYWMDWNDSAELRMLADKITQTPNEVITLQREGHAVSGTVEQLVGQLGMPALGGSYFTFSDENNYQIWNFLKQCYKNGWVYRGSDSIPWCARCGTGISQHEIDTEGYRDVDDPSITTRFRLKRADFSAAEWASTDAEATFAATPDRFALAWTTTPWTLPANVMLAVGERLTYAIVHQTHKDGEQAIYLLSKHTLAMLRGDHTVLGTLAGAAMAGWAYHGIFDELDAWKNANADWATASGRGADGLAPNVFEHVIIPWDEVGETEGTGIVHIAPGCGPEDHQLGKLHKTPMVAPLDEDGNYLAGFGTLTGRYAHEVPDLVESSLRAKGLFYKREKYRHRYAHCWRCGSPLVYRLVDEWYISMNKLRHQMMTVSSDMNWIPGFGKERELDWLRNMHDWMISKKRYWGLALPIWEYPDGTFEVIGSHEELKERAVEGWQDFEGHTPHRPWIDLVKIRDPKTGQIGTRVPDVGNPWLDAGIVAYATLGYRTNRANWEKWFPADFITESFPGQFRNWFYSLIAMSTVLEERPPARTVLGFATLLDGKGKPMHKSSGNMIEFNEAAERAGADTMRWVYARQRVDDNLLFGYDYLDQVRRETIIPLWNVYSFFITYANIDGWTPQVSDWPVAEPSALDRWILARLAETTRITIEALDGYEARPAALAIERFIDDLSNWYVRRSRERFWSNERSPDKRAAYDTLHTALGTLARLMAPFTPMLAEALWLNLADGTDAAAAAARDGAFSVHHEAYPVPRALDASETALLREVAIARTAVNLGHSLRSQSKVRLRQPLSRIMVVADAEARQAIEAQSDVIAAELNVKAIEFAPREEDLVTYRILPDSKKLGPKHGQNFPRLRAALQKLDAGAVVAAVRAGKSVTLDDITVAPDEILVQAQPREGLVVEGAEGLVLALDMTLTESLVNEGLAREVIRRVNDLRKATGLQLTDRIALECQASARLHGAIQSFASRIADETLAATLHVTLGEENFSGDTFDGETLALKIGKLTQP